MFGKQFGILQRPFLQHALVTRQFDFGLLHRIQTCPIGSAFIHLNMDISVLFEVWRGHLLETRLQQLASMPLLVFGNTTHEKTTGSVLLLLKDMKTKSSLWHGQQDNYWQHAVVIKQCGSGKVKELDVDNTYGSLLIVCCHSGV